MNKFIIALTFLSTFVFSDELRLSIPAIHCPLCIAIVRDEIKELQGVQSVKVDLKTKSATVIIDKSANINDILNATAKAGYESTVLKQP
ncbi:heavy-metal-associated domain-containing protein [Campylobacter sp. 19-13652]|uniref:heavy-metal-associated domain-containing protein n=1 Tax=Campylobacter sp. 19-13652 TaxID=2840180 RepID=UPI001C75BA4D|nr:heavy metal-associated domain-containing protein [Campylobacter sp. 19-13652]BCX80026.1 heavy metal transporter [Campylobacter sp. 19-13652]